MRRYHHRLEHVLSILLRRIEMSEEAGGPISLSPVELRQWVSMNGLR